MMIRNIQLDIESDHNIQQICQEIAHDYYDTQRVRFEQGDVVLDIGAHVGVFACWMAKAHPQVNVIAYEPVPNTFAWLKKNTDKFDNITAYNVAVDVRTTLTIQHRPEVAYCSSGHYGKKIEAESVAVPCVSLDDILAMHDKVKFMKLDCEGSEWELLLKSKLLDKVEYIGMELHMLPQFQPMLPEIKDLLKPWFLNDKVSIHIVNKLEAEGI